MKQTIKPLRGRTHHQILEFDIDTSSPSSNVALTQTNRRLTAAEFQGLVEVPPELEWFANITNERTRSAYRTDLQDFQRFYRDQKNWRSSGE